METMKAVRVHEFGGPEVLVYEVVPKPEPGAGDLLVRVRAAGVNPGEAKIRQGDFAQWHPLPFTLGYDYAGVVEALGPGVTGFSGGEEIYASPDSTRDGGYAEYAVVRASEVAPKPGSLDFIHAASVPLAGLTAWQALFQEAGLSAGQSVLIHGGGGAVGSSAVQFAKVKGARVYATGTGEDLDWLRQIGADTIIDYKGQKFEDVARDVDVVLDTIGGETQQRSWQTLKPGGILIATTRPPDEAAAQAHGVRAGMVGVRPNPDQLRQIAGLIDGGQVETRVGVVLPLADARRAHELLQQGHTHGKIVLRVD